ncbi:MAG: hypothetical protein M1839_001870 [Geoglossum umbratile]|nr:MAG: hypothetical protein M1839_001870 [Geoglossum umbratile]
MTDLAPSALARGSFNVHNSDASNNRFAFLVHSQDTLPNNLPPRVDDKPLARQKRRRTSPEDQSLLEAEYEKNPRPDKATRMEIVSRVSLGEKEVQIWFQNRRQNTRRKSRPLLPHEVVPSHQPSSSAEALGVTARAATDNCQSSSSVSAYSLQDSAVPQATRAIGEEKNQVENSMEVGGCQIETTVIAHLPRNCDLKLGANMNNNYQERTEGVTSQETTNCDEPNTTAPKGITGSQTTKPSQEHTHLTPGLGYISNRRNILSGSVSLPSGTRPTIMPSMQGTVHSARTRGGNEPAPPLRRTSSLVRLSLSLDGKAEIVMSEEKSPTLSQPVSWKALAPRTGGLQRSKSAVDFIERPGRRLSSGASLPGAGIGRSRDARTWEFYCDNEARSASLTQENSGSAIEAINLLRARKKTPLQTSMNKRNARIGLQEPSKRLKPTPSLTQKQKLARTTSSLARLQTTNENETKEPAKSKASGKSSLGDPSLSDNPGDSDKENWIPGTKQVAEQRQSENPLSKPVLGRGGSNPSRYTISGVTADREWLRQRHLARPYPIPGLEVDTEEPKGVGSRPRESRSSSSFSGEEELDCVQNLLSLRKGCWR